MNPYSDTRFKSKVIIFQDLENGVFSKKELDDLSAEIADATTIKDFKLIGEDEAGGIGDGEESYLLLFFSDPIIQQLICAGFSSFVTIMLEKIINACKRKKSKSNNTICTSIQIERGDLTFTVRINPNLSEKTQRKMYELALRGIEKALIEINDEMSLLCKEAETPTEIECQATPESSLLCEPTDESD